MRTNYLLASLALLATTTWSQENRPPVMVSLADGSSLPLAAWSFAYEFTAWPAGSSPALAEVRRPETTELWVGKKSYPTAGSTLEIRYDMVERQRENENGQLVQVKIPVARSLVLAGPAGRHELKPEAPHRDLILAGPDKALLVQNRSLDLMGQTLTGTKRQICLLSYSAQVECGGDPTQRVVRIEFPR